MFPSYRKPRGAVNGGARGIFVHPAGRFFYNGCFSRRENGQTFAEHAAQPDMTQQRSRSFLVKTAGVVGVATLASRVTGMMRDMVTASFFGTGYIWDAFVVAYRIPNLFRRLFGEGALSGAVIPIVTESLEREGRPAANRLSNNILCVTAAFLALLTGAVAAVLAVLLLTCEGGASRIQLIYRLTLVMTPFLFFICLAGVLMGVLNALRHFFVPALSTVILNVVVIAAVVCVCPFIAGGKLSQIYGVGWGIVLAGVLQLLSQVAIYRRDGMSLQPRFDLHDTGLRRLVKLMIPSVIGLSIAQINILVSSVMAVSLGAGAVSALYYGDRLMEFPQGLFGVSIATAALPVMAQAAARRDMDGLRHALHDSLALSLLVMVPAFAGFVALGRPIVQVLFEHGRFTALSTANTVWALDFYAAGLFAFAGGRVVTQAFYAVQDTRTPVRIGVFVVALNLGLNAALMPFLYHVGLALANTISSAVNFYLLLRFLDARIGGVSYRKVLDTLARSALVSAVMAPAAAWLYGFLAGLSPAPGLLWRIGALSAALVAGVAITAGGYLLLRVPEAGHIFDGLMRRLRPQAD